MKLFDNALMTVNLLGMLRVWGLLVEAYYGKASHGTTAEIYAYHLTRYNPIVHVEPRQGKLYEQEKSDVALNAANALCAIIEEFCSEYADCQVEIDGITLSEWCAMCNNRRHVYDHRCHVRVIAAVGGEGV